MCQPFLHMCLAVPLLLCLLPCWALHQPLRGVAAGGAGVLRNPAADTVHTCSSARPLLRGMLACKLTPHRTAWQLLHIAA